MCKLNENLINEVKQKETEMLSIIEKIQNGEAVSREELNKINTPAEPDWMYDKFGHIIPEKWIEWLTQLSSDVANDDLTKKVIMNTPVYNSLCFARDFIEKNRKSFGDLELSGTYWNSRIQKPISLQNEQIELVEQLIDEIVAGAIPCTVKEPEPTREDLYYGATVNNNEENNEVLRQIWHTGNGM